MGFSEERSFSCYWNIVFCIHCYHVCIPIKPILWMKTKNSINLSNLFGSPFYLSSSSSSIHPFYYQLLFTTGCGTNTHNFHSINLFLNCTTQKQKNEYDFFFAKTWSRPLKTLVYLYAAHAALQFYACPFFF